MKRFTMEVTKGEKYLVAICVEQPSCFTQGKTWDEIVYNSREVISLMLEIPPNSFELHIIDKTKPVRKAISGMME